jgi:hypothetical protein
VESEGVETRMEAQTMSMRARHFVILIERFNTMT